MTPPAAPRSFERLAGRIRRLGVSSPVLHLGAHPDDEDGALLAYASRGLWARTVYWSATRGEGGLNRTGSERGEALGVVRTWESLSARELDDAEVSYGPFLDTGFVKTAEQALERWGPGKLQRELVRTIRSVRPTVVVSRWRGLAEDGHGAHQAVGAAVSAACDAAGDPDVYPDLGLAPWRPLKLYRTLAGDWQPGEEQPRGPRRPDLERDGVLALDLGAIDLLTGRTFEEIAALGADRHRSQGIRLMPERGQSWHYLELERSDVAVPARETGLFDGFDPRLPGLVARLPDPPSELTSALETAAAAADDAATSLTPWDPEAAGRHLLRMVEALTLAVDSARRTAATDLSASLREISAAAEAAAAACFGLTLECTVDASRLVPGQQVRGLVRLWAPGRNDPAVSLGLDVPPGWDVEPAELPLERDEHLADEAAFDIVVPDDAAPGGAADAAASDPRAERTLVEPLELVGRAEAIVDGRPITLSGVAVWRDAVPGGYRESLPVVLPPITISPRERRVLIPATPETATVELGVVMTARAQGGTKGTLWVDVPGGWRGDPPATEVVLDRAGETRPVSVEVRVPGGVAPGAYRVAFAVSVGGRRDGIVVEQVRRSADLGGPGEEDAAMWEAFLTRPAAVEIDVVDVSFVPTLRYAYVPGLEEELVPALTRFPLDLRVLDGGAFEFVDLRDFDAVVVGPNAYVVREDVRRSRGRLLQYVEDGGTLIVQQQGYPYEQGGFAPFPFRFSRPHDRVTSPDAPVDVLLPDHPALHVPNRIGPADFEGWVGDRGAYFAGEWSREYEAVLACADPGEPPRAGGLLVASYGRGTFVYVGYSLYRQVPAGVAGALRLLANLLALAEARVQERMERARAAELLRTLTEEELRQVVRLMSERRFAPGEFLFHEGDRGGDVYVVLDGEVEIGRRGGDTWQSLGIAGRGEVTGELAVLADSPRSASLRARGDVRVLTIPGPPFRRLLSANPALADRVIRMLAEKLAGSDHRSG